MQDLSPATTRLTEIAKQSRVPQVTVGTTAPSSPAVGDLWVDTN